MGKRELLRALLRASVRGRVRPSFQPPNAHPPSDTYTTATATTAGASSLSCRRQGCRDSPFAAVLPWQSWMGSAGRRRRASRSRRCAGVQVCKRYACDEEGASESHVPWPLQAGPLSVCLIPEFPQSPSRGGARGASARQMRSSRPPKPVVWEDLNERLKECSGRVGDSGCGAAWWASFSAVFLLNGSNGPPFLAPGTLRCDTSSCCCSPSSCAPPFGCVACQVPSRRARSGIRLPV